MPRVHSNACNDVAALTSTPPRGGRTGDAACAHLPFDAFDVEVSSTPHPPVALRRRGGCPAPAQNELLVLVLVTKKAAT